MITQISKAKSVGFNLHFYSLLVVLSFLYFPRYYLIEFLKFQVWGNFTNCILQQFCTAFIQNSYSLVRYTIFCNLAPTYLCNLSSCHSFTLSKILAVLQICYVISHTSLSLCRCCSLCIPHKFQTSSTSCYIVNLLGSVTCSLILSSHPAWSFPFECSQSNFNMHCFNCLLFSFHHRSKVPLRWATFS